MIRPAGFRHTDDAGGHAQRMSGRYARVPREEPAYFSDCVQCGIHGRMYHHALCANCACPGVLQRLFSRDGQFGGAAAEIIEALLKCDRSAVLQWARHTLSRKPLAAGIRAMGDTLSHEALDCLPKLGALPLIVPAPVDDLLRELVNRRRGYAAVTARENVWLFSGGGSGQHISTTRMGVRLRQIGISPPIARNTALIDLAGELPAAVIANCSDSASNAP